MDRDNTHRKSLFSRRIELRKDSMNISKMYEDSVDSIKKTYNDTQLNPFKFPENINVTVKVDIAGSYKEFFQELKKMDEKDMKKIANVLESKMKMFTKLIK